MNLLLFLSIFILHQSPATPSQDASALEAQYRTCAKHYIPADKCTPDIYQQLKAKDEAPVDAKTSLALEVVKEYQPKLKNPDSMQVRTVYVLDQTCKKCGPDDHTVCLEIGAQNGAGGMTVSHVAYQIINGKKHWFEPHQSFGPLPLLAADDGWLGVCTTGLSGKLRPGEDITDNVKTAFGRAK